MDDHKLDSVLEARPLARNARAINAGVFFTFSVQLHPRFARVAGLLAEIPRVAVEGCVCHTQDCTVRQFVEIDVDILEEGLITVLELTEVNELGNNASFGDLATDFGLHPDSAHDDAPFCFCMSISGRILLSVIIGASVDAPDIFKKRSNPSSAQEFHALEGLCGVVTTCLRR